MGKLNGKVAVITGGGSGIGLATAQLFVNEGARVLVVDLRTAAAKTDPRLSAAAAAGQVAFLEADVSQDAASAAYPVRAVELFGRLDIVVLSAGLCHEPTSWVECDVSVLDRMVAVNVKGIFLGVKHSAIAMLPFARDLKASGGSCSMILISSTAGLRGSRGMSPYCASKWAVRGLSLTAAQEFSTSGIRTNAVFPGSIETDMYRTAFDDKHASTAIARTPLGRMGKANEIADVILFLASDEAGYVNGSQFAVHGGTVPT